MCSYLPVYSIGNNAGDSGGATSLILPYKQSHLNGNSAAATNPASLATGAAADPRYVPVLGTITAVVDASASVTAELVTIEVYDKPTNTVIWSAAETIDAGRVQTFHTYFEEGMAVIPISTGTLGHASVTVWDMQAQPAAIPCIRCVCTGNVSCISLAASVRVVRPSELVG